MNSVYGPNTLFNQLCSGNFDVKDALYSERPIAENVDVYNDFFNSNRLVSIVSNSLDLTNDQRTVWSNLNKAEYRKKHDVWVPHEFTPK